MSQPDDSYLLNADPAAIDQLYEQYRADKESVDFGWRKFFEGFDFAMQNGTGNSTSSSTQSQSTVSNSPSANGAEVLIGKKK